MRKRDRNDSKLESEALEVTISIHYVPTDKMAANIFTKSLPVEIFKTVLMGNDSTQSAKVLVGVLEYRSNNSLQLGEN